MLDTVLLRIAKSAIVAELDSSYEFDKKRVVEQYDFLKKDAAAFVTLKYNKNLRGCIGSIIAHRTLYDDIVQNALSAAFNDPRFFALKSSEFSNLTIEVSVLSSPEYLEYEDFDDLCDKVKPYEDGLILKYKGYHGTFLPQVWEQLPTPKEFLEHLSIKAGTNSLVYAKHPDIYRYRVDAIEEEFDKIALLP